MSYLLQKVRLLYRIEKRIVAFLYYFLSISNKTCLVSVAPGQMQETEMGDDQREMGKGKELNKPKEKYKVVIV